MFNGTLMIDVDGLSLIAEDIELLSHPSVCGLILFTRNFENAEQLRNLIQSIRNIENKKLLISVDHEGGRVQRFRSGFTVLPAVRKLGFVYDKDKERARRMSKLLGWLMAAELRDFDIDFSFAPVVDLDYGNSEVIGDRAFHEDPDITYELASFYIDGMREAGMSCVAKHFPGHGAVSLDSHTDIPVDERDLDTIKNIDMLPFKRLIDNKPDAIMPAHVIYTKADSSPAGFSKYWLQTILRDELGFDGLIISDDLNMQGASVAGSAYSDRAVAAFDAGCDMALMCNNRSAVINILDNVPMKLTRSSEKRLQKMCGQGRPLEVSVCGLPQWNEAQSCIEYIRDNID